MLNLFAGMGRLTSDVELKTTQNGKSLASFSVAIERRFTKSTDFIPCIAWGQTAEFVSQYFHKGDMIAVVGEMQTGSYEDKDGKKRTRVEINVQQASFCGGKKEETKSEVTPSFDVLPDDDLPF